MKIEREKYNKGLELLEKLHGGHAGEAIVSGLKDICPDFALCRIRFQ